MIARPARTLLVCLLLALAVASTLGAQDHVPVPYTPGEFAPWMRDVWRAEVIAVGSFPFTLFLTLEVYDSWRYATNGFNPSYAPWPIGSGPAPPIPRRKRHGLPSRRSLSPCSSPVLITCWGVSVNQPRTVEARVEDPAAVGMRLDVFISESLGLFSRSQVRSRILSIEVNGSPARLARRLKLGDRVSLVCAEPPAVQALAEDLPLDIIFENNDVIVIDKPQGMVVHPGSGNHSGTLLNALLFHCSGLAAGFPADDPRPGIVHRLDKETSGVIIAAKNARAHDFLASQFQDRSVQKRYIAIAAGTLPCS